MNKQLSILGLDVSKSSVSCCLLFCKPGDPRQFYYKYNFLKIHANREGIDQLLALQPDIALLEPTGSNYSRIWSEHLLGIGTKVLWVGHKEMRNYRGHQLGLPDKDDDADALALACYWFDYGEEPSRFVNARPLITESIRYLILRLNHLNRVQSPIINRIRQDLSWQFPESVNFGSKRRNQKVPTFWIWLSAQNSCVRYDNLYSKSIGLGIQESVKLHASRICSLQEEEISIEKKLAQILASKELEPYIRVFERFGFGFRLQVTILSQVYPLERFLVDGKPEVKICRGRFSKKPTKRHLSLRKFQKTLGLAPSLEQSGDKKRVTVEGSSMCRKAFWQWVFSCLEPRMRRPNTEIGKLLCDYLDTEKSSGKPIKLVRMRTAAKAVKMLFRELVKELSP